MWQIKFFSLTLLFYIVLDAIWLFGIGNGIYRDQIGTMIRELNMPSLLCALVVYILLTIGLILFVLPKAVNFSTAFAYGLLYGCIIYGIYNLTNYALLKQWTFAISITDFIWGMLLNTLAAGFCYYLSRWFANA